MKNNFISLVEVRYGDKNQILKWRNEFSSRKQSINQKKISVRDHDKWFYKFLRNKKNLFWKLKLKNSFCGFVRLSKKKKHYELSYLISTKHRRKELGSLMLKKMLKKQSVVYMLNQNIKILAKTKKTNLASNKCLIKSGFKFLNCKNNINKYRYQL